MKVVEKCKFLIEGVFMVQRKTTDENHWVDPCPVGLRLEGKSPAVVDKLGFVSCDERKKLPLWFVNK